MRSCARCTSTELITSWIPYRDRDSALLFPTYILFFRFNLPFFHRLHFCIRTFFSLLIFATIWMLSWKQGPSNAQMYAISKMYCLKFERKRKKKKTIKIWMLNEWYHFISRANIYTHGTSIARLHYYARVMNIRLWKPYTRDTENAYSLTHSLNHPPTLFVDEMKCKYTAFGPVPMRNTRRKTSTIRRALIYVHKI